VSKPRGGLGKGLGAIIPTETVEALDAPTDTPTAGLRDIPVGDIIPNEYQPREYFNEEDLVSLTDSIRQLGVLQPVLVREAASGGYELIAGERRWRAAQRVGLTVIPAVIRKVEDQAALEQALVELRPHAGPGRPASGQEPLGGRECTPLVPAASLDPAHGYRRLPYRWACPCTTCGAPGRDDRLGAACSERTAQRSCR